MYAMPSELLQIGFKIINAIEAFPFPSCEGYKHCEYIGLPESYGSYSLSPDPDELSLHLHRSTRGIRFW